MRANITLDGLEEPITQITSAVIRSSMATLADTATLELPSFKDGTAQELENLFTPGRGIKVEVGYEGHLATTFTGYVSSRKPTLPFRVECTDATYLLQQVNLSKSWKPGTATLATVLDYVISEVNAAYPEAGISLNKDDLPEVNLQQFRLSNVSAAKALQKLSDEYGLTIYFEPGTARLYAGLAYVADRGDVKFNFYTNIIDHRLKFRKEDERKMRIKAVGITADNQKTTVEVGPAEGELRTIFKYDISSKAELKQLAEEERKKLAYTGYEGSLTAFLLPYVTHGYSAELVDERYPERAGTYHVDAVKTTFSESGGRNEVELGIKLSA